MLKITCTNLVKQTSIILIVSTIKFFTVKENICYSVRMQVPISVFEMKPKTKDFFDMNSLQAPSFLPQLIYTKWKCLDNKKWSNKKYEYDDKVNTIKIGKLESIFWFYPKQSKLKLKMSCIKLSIFKKCLSLLVSSIVFNLDLCHKIRYSLPL